MWIQLSTNVTEYTISLISNLCMILFRNLEKTGKRTVKTLIVHVVGDTIREWGWFYTWKYQKEKVKEKSFNIC